MPSYITGPRPKRENCFSLNANNLSGKILLWRLITLRETGLNGLCLKRILSFWQRVGLLEGKRGQPVGACLPFYTPCFLFFLVFPFFLFSSLPFLSQCLLIYCDSLLDVAITVFVMLLSLCTVKVLYIVPVVIGFYNFSL